MRWGMRDGRLGAQEDEGRTWKNGDGEDCGQRAVGDRCWLQLPWLDTGRLVTSRIVAGGLDKT